jgi:hypothetical protein
VRSDPDQLSASLPDDYHGACGPLGLQRLPIIRRSRHADAPTVETVADAAEVRAEIHPRLADEAKTAQFLASKGEVLTPAAMTLFLDAKLLRRRASGD